VRIRIALADDHPIVLQGLQQLFERQSDFQVVSCCANGNDALEGVRTHHPDVLLLDLRMPDVSGLDVLRAISEEKLECRTVLLTAAVTDDEVMEAVRLGVRGLILKESLPEALVDCVRRVYQGEEWLESETVTRACRKVLDRESANREAAGSLTPREIQIVRMIAEGLRNRAIAGRLSISEGTVKVHLHNIYEKFGVDGRLALLLSAREKGLI
jgi:two-component system, NarL family, nitrate/nitrite response regulator NarL